MAGGQKLIIGIYTEFIRSFLVATLDVLEQRE